MSMNDFIGVIENNNTVFNKDITVSDLDGNVKVVIKCYCTIEKKKSMSYYIDIIDNETYLKAPEDFQVEINNYVEEAKTLAQSLEVPFIL